MSEKTDSSILRRKAKIGQEQFKARAMTAARALRITLSKVAQDEMGLALAAIGLKESRGPAEPVLSALDENTLLLLLDSPGRGPGAALIDSSLASSVVQQLTMGYVTEPRENQPARKPTKTEAALVGPTIDSLFNRAGSLPDTAEEAQILSGLRFGADIANIRLLGMALEADEYAHFAITVDIAGGKRQGKIDLLLPIPDAKADMPDPETVDEDLTPDTLEPTVMGLTAQLRVALCRVRMPFSQLADLVPGDTLPLPDGVLDNAEVLTLAGRKVTSGKMGQIDGLRAIRLAGAAQWGERRNGSGQEAGGQGADAFGAPTEFKAHEPEQSGFPADALPALSDMSEPSGADTSDLPELSDLPDLPELPELPDAAGGPDAELPDLPDLPELPGEFDDLPELPDLPMAQPA